MELKQTLKLSQQLVMTPQLQQAIKLLQMSRLELVETITEEVETNPALEESTEQEEAGEQEETGETPTATDETVERAKSEVTEDVSSMDASQKDLDWEQYVGNYNTFDYPSSGINREEAPSYENFLRTRDTLTDHLIWQLRLSRLDERRSKIAEYIIGNIGDDGYLKITVDEIVNEADVSPEEIESALAVVQEFDPVGIGSRNLKECLMAQARHLGLADSLVGKIITDYLEEIEKRKLPVITKGTGATLDEVIAAVKVISAMEPRPGRPYAEDQTQYVIPDLYIHKIDDEYVIVQNEEGLPRLKISQYYRKVMEAGGKKGEAREYIQEKVRAAMWLIKSIHQRQRTIYRVMESILRFQRVFFDHGVQCLKPLVLKDVADDIGMHESTISRVTNNKYVNTPHGIFELKFFFNSAIGRSEGEDIASESVKEKIRLLVNGENSDKPLSDQALVGLLKSDGINIARRTITKYREMLGIPSSSKRKKLF